MALGYIGGIKKAVFTLFLYKVPLNMLTAEYKRYSESGNVDTVVVGLGTFLTAFGLMELLDYGSVRRKPQ